ncbi:hypothetical protein [Natrarchaeobius chitinivorans]|uniref:Uncharacterized protein n=1 Tax=Natrarchaeobius chitinivorans TaxID=1679083 RepID=A0A3N6MH34_NATCH|nr:hypothetical protein [Natrarchaeobius chitinivorans]RQG94901.1 hypothetical protein EA473_10405 [Natrarchaeobius chitinivorans]
MSLSHAIEATLEEYSDALVELIGIVGMVMLVVGSTLEEGTLVQRLLFLVGPIVLLLVAYHNREMMLTVLQVVIILGSAMAFFPTVPLAGRLPVLMGAAILSVGYLVWIDYRRKDRFWPIGGAGLLMLAAGFTISSAHLVAFNALLAVGSVLMAVYSTLGLIFLRVRIMAIWIVLNVAFAIAPGIRLVALLN